MILRIKVLVSKDSTKDTWRQSKIRTAYKVLATKGPDKRHVRAVKNKN